MSTSSVRTRLAAVVTCVLCAGRVFGGGEDASERLARGRAVIEENCGDAYPASREVLEKGIADLIAAIQQGVDTADAHRLLACAYATLGSRFARQGDERVAIAHKEREALRRAAQLDPRDLASRMRLGDVTADKREQIDAYNSVLAIDPNHARALYASGKLLLRSNEKDKGLGRIERAAEVAGPEDAAAWGDEVVRLLREQGRGHRADELKVKLNAKAKWRKQQ